jgi:hypothetical protein
MGIDPPRILQRGGMDSRLRNGLWNVIDALIQRLESVDAAAYLLGRRGETEGFLELVWVDFLSAARDMFRYSANPRGDVRQWYYQAPWNKVYDLFEFIASNVNGNRFVDECNVVLEREKSAYRIVGSQVIEVTDETSLSAISDALEVSTPVPLVHKHLRTAVERLADRDQPDYRNAAKEAICAVETLIGTITGSPGETLDGGLKLLEKRKLLPLHPSVLRSWSALYGYTSDAGIRHGMIEGQADIGLDDAVYAVVTCSAIVNLLIALAAKHNVSLS